MFLEKVTNVHKKNKIKIGLEDTAVIFSHLKVKKRLKR